MFVHSQAGRAAHFSNEMPLRVADDGEHRHTEKEKRGDHHARERSRAFDQGSFTTGGAAAGGAPAGACFSSGDPMSART